jgi:hypothetical protein
MIAIGEGALFQGMKAPSEIIPALLSELERLDGNAREVGATRAEDIRREIPSDPTWFHTQDAEVIVEDLICALSDCAGNAEYYFGRKHPSSSEFGFWRCAD